MTLDEAMAIFESSHHSEWSTAHLNPDVGSSSSLYLTTPGLSIVSLFQRMSDRSADLGEPWVQPGHTAAWRGTVRVISGTDELVEVAGFSVRATARVPEPDSPADRSVEAWKIGLFRLSSLLEYGPQARDDWPLAQFDEALKLLGITSR
jgi:hypothetical protein